MLPQSAHLSIGFNSPMGSSITYFPRTLPAGTLATVLLLLLGRELHARTLPASLGTRSRIRVVTAREKWKGEGMHEGKGHRREKWGETSRFGCWRSHERKMLSQPPVHACTQLDTRTNTPGAHATQRAHRRSCHARISALSPCARTHIPHTRRSPCAACPALRTHRT